MSTAADATWLAHLRALLIDLDGVVYRGDVPLPGASELGPTLSSLSIAYAFVTNNATLAPEAYQTKLRGMGVPVEPRHIVTSATATVEHLRRLGVVGKNVCVVGEQGLIQAIAEAGFNVTDSDPAVVVAGLDRNLTYQRLIAATRGVLGGAAFIATNVDRALPVEDGLWPGAGSIVAAIATATGVQPTVMGKPGPALLEVALERLDVRPDDAAIVGDQVQTDIRAGIAAGMATILVTGDLAEEVPGISADLVVRDLAEALDHLRRARQA